MDDAEIRFTEIFIWTISRWATIFSFRQVSVLSLHSAAPQIVNKHAGFVNALTHDSEYKDLFIDRERFIADGGPKKLIQQMSRQTIDAFQASVDAASLVFAHSILDSAALDYLRVTALISQRDWIFALKDKKIPLVNFEKSSFDQLLEQELNKYLDALDRESLLRKLDLLFSFCKPPSNFEPLENYNYNRERIQQLDRIRHGIVHGEGPVTTLPNGDDDIDYLQKTCWFLMSLVNQKYGVKIDPEYLPQGQKAG